MQAAEESSRQEIQVMQDALVVAGQVKVDLHKAQAALHEEVAFPDVLPFQVFPQTFASKWLVTFSLTLRQLHRCGVQA